MYQPVLNRFLSRDPLPREGQPDILYDNHWFGDRMTWMRNTYGYASNNPVNRVDPSGEQDELAEVVCFPLALFPQLRPPTGGTPECKNRRFKIGCLIFPQPTDQRGNCPKDFQRVEDILLVAGKVIRTEYCIKCSPTNCTKGTCIPCVADVVGEISHPIKGKLVVDKNSKQHLCRCFE